MILHILLGEVYFPIRPATVGCAATIFFASVNNCYLLDHFTPTHAGFIIHTKQSYNTRELHR
jgi:hypothetical protein